MTERNRHTPEEIHLPAPSIWPPLLALAIMLLLLGVVFRGVLTVVGLLLLLAALGGWIFEEEIARGRAR